MVAGCPVDAQVWVCLYRSYPELLLILLVVVFGFFLVWRRWARLLIAVVMSGLILLLKKWGLLR